LALSLAPVVSWHATASTGPRFHEDGQTDRPGNRKGQTMTEASVSFAGNLTDDPEVRYTEGGDAPGHVPGGRQRSAGPGGVVLHRGRVAGPGRACRRVCRKGAGSWSWVDSSSGHGRLRTAPLGRWSRSWPRSWGRACVGQRRPRPGRRGARSRRVPRRPGRLNERHPASWKLWLQDLVLDSLETSAGIVGGWSSLALLPHVRPQGGL
jgi:hypothetical protein